ncbi:MAG: insulinase family protein [Thiotrichales bacterium]|nr:MAG: insulinase family protein [Thiotrichales bacterium]
MTIQVAQSSPAQKGNAHPAFTWIRSQHIDSLNVTVEEYRHKETGAMHYHIDADNNENVFLVAFRTVPMDSTGVAHILEHTALCGSEKFPVRDPFFMMIRRSLNTFMNAFTSSDWTAYPFSSQNRKDFNNLLDVYLDAAFFSRLDELDFLQEGHRVEFTDPENPQSDLEFKGVVFNEMKGAMSSPVSVLWQTLSEKLYPTTTYHYNSGGDPVNIPDLSYRQLREFYQTHYHPSNAIFMTFGDIPAHEHQQQFEDKALRHFDRLDINIHVDDEQRFDEPVVVDDIYAFDVVEGETDQHKTHHVLGWLLGPSTELDEVMKSNLLSHVLLENSSSPLRKALETTTLGSAPSPLCGLEDSNYEMCFMCGIEGSDPDSAEAFEKLVLDVLQDVADNGVPQHQLEAVLHQLELSQREIGGDGYPYGLQLILSGLSAAIHRADPSQLLNLDPVIDSLREKIKDPTYIQRLVRELLLDNPHRVRLTMRPDTGLSARKDEAERERLARMKAAMSDNEKSQVIQRAAELALRQQQEDDAEVLPKVGLEDVPNEIKIPAAIERRISATDSKLYAQGTNGLVYHEMVAELPALEPEQLDVLPLYSSCLTELGVGDRDYLQVQDWQSGVSGGISALSSIRGRSDDVQNTRGYYVFSGKALERNSEKLSELMHATIHSVRFDEADRIRELISQRRARREQSVTGNGHTLAMTAASSGMCPVASLGHRFNGLEGIRILKAVDDANKQGAVSELAGRFSEVHNKLVAAPRQYMIIAEEEKLDAVVNGFEKIWTEEKPDPVFQPFTTDPLDNAVKQMWITNTQVNFCARAYKTVPMDHPDAAPLSVLGGFLRNGFLHTAIREKGGAYGGGASHDTNIAAFRFFSYRDPRLSETLDDFDRAIEWMLTGKHEWRMVEEAILGVIGSIDKPGSPAGEARQAFHNLIHGRSADKLQAFRQNVLKVRLDDLARVTETYLHPDQASTAVITSAATLEQAGNLGLDVINL